MSNHDNSISAKNRRRLKLIRRTVFLPPNQPDQDQAHHRRADADRPQDIVRCRKRAFHRPPHPGWTGCKQQALNHEQDSHTDEEVGERDRPHRTGTSRSNLALRRPKFASASSWPTASYGFGDCAAAGSCAAAGGLPETLLKNLKKSDSGRSRKRVSLLFNPFS